MNAGFDTLLLDMDEVVTDFRGAASRIHGYTPEHVNALTINSGVWSMEESLGLTADQFWEPIAKAGVPFWLNLDPMPWFEPLIKLVTEVASEEWYIVTAPSRCHTSYTGKVIWLKIRLGQHFDRFFITRHKSKLANPRTLLIDDRPDNIRKFENAGGKGIMFPGIGNRLHPYMVDPVDYLSKQLYLRFGR